MDFARKISNSAATAAKKAAVAAEGTAKKGLEQTAGVRGDISKGLVKAGDVTKKVVAGAINQFITPEFLAFVKNPSAEALQANPQIVLTGLTILAAVGHPQAAIGKAMLVSAASVGAGEVMAKGAATAKEATATVAGAAVSESTAGIIPADQAAHVIKNMSAQDMKQLMEIMTYAAKFAV